MDNRLHLFTAALLLTLVSAAGLTRAAAAEQAEKPNFLLIMADDVGREALGCYGGTSYKTPQIDALAADGLRFRHCYSMPVCHPTRLTIMTGRYPFRNPAGWGAWPAGVKTFAHVLRDAGYATAVAGKWQLTLMRRQTDHAQRLGFA
ncbi:MAG: sulfatase-like hydrolase/transferase, partial [Planctomycetota bacterium]